MLDNSGEKNVAKRSEFRTKSELEAMSIKQLRKETAELAQTWYSSGQSGISFGDSNVDSVVNKLVDGAGRTSLTKDYMSLKKRLSSLDNGGGSGIMNAEMFRKSGDFRQSQKFISDREFSNITIEARKKRCKHFTGNA